ncbi:hypothetical protein WJX81_003801 [Elliptochloris bilobata]|uniref:D-arabinitol 2-dehydrogenase [ribulose-forming] n=1 Tax=Elliptochloris bilobata TaxID=381761 RepID=A0AAW1RG22_9CHLO
MAPGAENCIHSTGQPDTPVEVLVDVLSKALRAPDAGEMKRLVEQAYKLVAGLDPYLDTVSTPPSPVCQELIHASLSHPWADAHSQGKTRFLQKKECCAGGLEGRFIATLCRLAAAKTVLEVGMFTGTTTLAVAQQLPEDGKVYALEIEEYMRDFSQPYFRRAGVDKKVDVVVGPASDSLERLAALGVRFDLAFLDADKGGYLGYYKQLMDNNLILPGGAIVVDNTLMKGRTYEPDGVKDESADAIREFNDFVRRDARVDVVVLPFRDGVSIITRRAPTDAKDEVATGLHGNLIMQRLKLNGRVALITGGGQGIGRAFAHALGEAGAAIAIVDVVRATAEATAAELAGKGIRSVAVVADITRAKDCERMVAETVAALGGLDIAVNNAGVNMNNAAEDTPEDEWDMTFNVNTKGLFLCCQAEGRHMLAAGRGRIINTASMASLLVPHPQKQIAYNASKAAVVKITQTLGCEWADRGVTVNCMSPGIVNTALIQESDALRPLCKEWLAQIPAGRLAEVTDLQAAIVLLASDAASYMTGHNLVLDGGHTLW